MAKPAATTVAVEFAAHDRRFVAGTMRHPPGGAWRQSLAIGFRIFVQVVLDVTVFCLRGPRRLVRRALDLLRGTANRFAGDFLNFSRRFLDSSFHLIFIDAHGLSPAKIAGERPTRLRRDTIIRSTDLPTVGSRSDSLSEFRPGIAVS